MTVTEKGKQKLFRMTTQRKIKIERIITTLNLRISNLEEDGFSRMLLEENSHITEEERTKRLKKMDEDRDALYVIHDVLEVVIAHGDESLLNLHMKVDRGWKNEWDVPLAVFTESIDKLICMIEELQRKFSNPEIFGRDKYQEQIDLLIHLKAFRNE